MKEQEVLEQASKIAHLLRQQFELSETSISVAVMSLSICLASIIAEEFDEEDIEDFLENLRENIYQIIISLHKQNEEN